MMRSLKQDDGTFHTMKAGVGLPEKMIEDMVKSGYFDSTFERNIPVDRQSDVQVELRDLLVGQRAYLFAFRGCGRRRER